MKITIPFLNTSPLLDIQLLFYFIPLWWILGIEQFVWFFILLLSLMKVWLSNKRIIFTRGTLLLMLFILASSISILTIQEPVRYITFFRNSSVYLSALLLTLIITNTVTKKQEVMRVLQSVVISMMIISLIGSLAIANILRPEFTSFVGYFFPSSLEGIGYIRGIMYRDVGYVGWFSWVGGFFRVSSVFLFSTLYAAALATILPIAFYLHQKTKGFSRLLYTIGILSLIVNLLFTTGRMAIFGFLLGGIFWLFYSKQISSILRLFITIITFTLALVALFFVPIETYQNSLQSTFEARGTSSDTRMLIYQETIKGILQSPIVGWGTERDVPGLPYPAGSHSYYLGIFYRHGIIGFTLFLLIFISLWNKALYSRNLRKTHVSSYLGWSLVAIFTNSLTDSLDLDILTSMVMWSLFSIIMVSYRLSVPLK